MPKSVSPRNIFLTIATVVLAGAVFIGVTGGSPFAARDTVVICHVPPDNPSKAKDLNVKASAVASHIDNHPDDAVGSCEDNCKINNECPRNECLCDEGVCECSTTTTPTTTSTTTTTTSTTTTTTPPSPTPSEPPGGVE